MAHARPSRRNGPYLLPAVCVFAATLSGCGAITVKVAGGFPEPAMQPLPLRVGLYLDDDLKRYVHHEQPPEGRRWEVDVGEANQLLFQRLSAGMFVETSTVSEARASAGMSLDAVLQPSIEKVQVSIPVESDGDGLYEIWISYRIRLFNPDGQLVADWPVLGYGQTPVTTFGGKEKGMREAAVEAMRDAAAALVHGFRKQPAVVALLHAVRPRSPQDRGTEAPTAGEASHAPIPPLP